MMLNVPLLPSRHSVQFYLSVTLTHIFFDPLIANSVSARMLEAVFRLCWQTPLLGIAGKQPRHFHPHSPPPPCWQRRRRHRCVPERAS